MQKQETEITKKQRKSSVGKNILFAILAVLAIVIVVITVLYHDEITISLRVKKISDAPAYYVDIKGDYHFDEYLETGSLSYQELYDFLYKKFSYGLYQPVREKQNCSGFVAQTPDGDYILCHDLDTTPKAQWPIVMRSHLKKEILGIANIWKAPEKQELSLFEKFIVNVSPYFMMDGMNEAGLSVCIAGNSGSVCKIDTNKITIQSDTLTQTILNHCTTVREAIEYLKDYNLANTHNICHFLLADASGDSAILEWYDGVMTVVERSKPYQIFANFMVYNNPNLNGFGKDRYLGYEKALEACNGIITEEDALELLKENVIPCDACWSCVYNLNKKTMKVTFHGDYENIYTYNLD